MTLALADTSVWVAHFRSANPLLQSLALIERERIHGLGRSATDVGLLASVLLTPEMLLWTIDKKLGALAAGLGAASTTAGHQPESREKIVRRRMRVPGLQAGAARAKGALS